MEDFKLHDTIPFRQLSGCGVRPRKRKMEKINGMDVIMYTCAGMTDCEYYAFGGTVCESNMELSFKDENKQSHFVSFTLPLSHEEFMASLNDK